MSTILRISNVPICINDFTGPAVEISNTPLDIAVDFNSLAKKYLTKKEAEIMERLPVSSQVRLDKFWSRILLKKKFTALHNIQGKDFRQIEIVNSKEVNSMGLPLIYYRGAQFPVHLSISHCEGRVGVALNPKPCGIDIVKALTMEEHAKTSFLNYALTPDERLQISAKESIAGLELMTLIWGIKEAVSKYLGCGLMYGPATIQVTFSEKEDSVELTIHPKIVIKNDSGPLKIFYCWYKQKSYCHVYVE